MIGYDKFVIVCIYRPSSYHVEILFERIILILDQYLTENVEFIIAGDFNGDLQIASVHD